VACDFDDLHKREFSRLDAGGHAYLDYTGSGLYGESQIRAHAELLSRSVLGNPHSRNPTSMAATELVERTRERILAFFDADPGEYEVIPAPNASGALKLVGESYPFHDGSLLVLPVDNHNSVHGVREFARAKGAAVRYLPLDTELRIPDVQSGLAERDASLPNLFIYPAQSNFSGVKHPLEWIGVARRLGYDVFLDAAAFVPTNPLSMRGFQPDFVSVSFYKMFGFPTGVGALLARRQALERLQRPWFSGGMVRFVSAQAGVELPYRNARGFEDGTLNFLDIAAVPSGLDLLHGVGVERVREHVAALTAELLQELQNLTHRSGAPLVQIYGPASTQARGGTVALNVLDPEGRAIDFRTVQQRASAANISVRGGYFCNPGAAESALGHDPSEVSRCAGQATWESFSLERFSECIGRKPAGAVRVSLGIASNREDIRRLLAMLTSFRDGE
jgi:molybdenum cofactor sulfurtransferase